MPENAFSVDAIEPLFVIPADKSRRDSFQIVDQFTQLNRGGRPKKQMDVILFAIEIEQFGFSFFKSLPEDRVQPLRWRASIAQRLMDQGDRNRPFADCRRHALEAASADVADREHPGQTRFQEIRGLGERQMRHGQIVLRQIRPRFDEPFRVERDAPV